MRIMSKREHLADYQKSVRFLVVSLSLLACSILIVILLMIYFAKAQKETVEKSMINQLNQTHHNLLMTTRNMEYLARQIYFDPALTAYSVGTDRADFAQSVAAANQLSMYLANYNYLHSIYYYNARLNEFYTSHTGNVFKREVFFDVGAADLVSDFLDYDGLLIRRTIPVPYQQVEKEVYTVFCYDKSAANQEQRNIVMINMNAEYILQYLQANNQENGQESSGCTVLLNKEGELLGITPHDYMGGGDIQAIREQVLDREDVRRNFTVSIEGKKMFVVFMPSESVNWILVGIQPYDRLFHQANRMFITVLIVSFIVVGVLTVFIALLPGKVITPMAAMESLVEIEKSNRQSMAWIMQQQYLKMLLHTDMRNNRDEVKTKLSWLECRINMDAEYLLFLFVFDFERMMMEDKPAEQIKRQVMQRITEVYCSQELELDNFFVDMDFNQNVWAVSREHAGLISEDNYYILRHMIEEVHQKTQVWFSVIVSENSADLFGLERIYAKTGSCQEQLFITGPGSIIEAVNQAKIQQADYIYPSLLEEHMLNAIRQGDGMEGMNCFDKLIDKAVAAGQSNVVMFTLRHAAMSLKTLLSSYKSAEPLPEGIHDVIPGLDLYNCKTVKEARELFCQAILELSELYQKPQDSRHNQIVSDAVQIIKDSYGDPDLDLNRLAGEAKLSAVYFGRMFKKITGKTAGNYIQEYRIEMAKELLDKTQDSVQKIAEKTGFSSTSYFSTVFRKLCRMSPNEYRHRPENEQKM